MVKWHSAVKNPSKARSPHFFLGLLFITAFLCFSNLPLAHSAQVTLEWDPSPSAVSGYKIYYGTSAGKYPNSADAGANTTYTLNLTAPTQYIVAKAYDASGNESAPSNQVVAHTMTASAGAGGAISLSGTSYAAQGSSKTFSITPNAGY
ncbi:MAG: fibronectin type III domain-containing protein, partial [Syntrophobacteraceae bacterium]|nr:fibronectin type III domain-containing protein [Syntrophobacteraceae bacterium]